MPTTADARPPTRTTAVLVFALVAVALLLAAAAVLLHRHAHGRLVLAMQQRPLPAAGIQAETGHCFFTEIGTAWMSSHEGPSPARVLEDGRDLGPANAAHDAIRKQGEGRFSFWHGNLYFSASDNSDPRDNGRHYEIVWPLPIAPALRVAANIVAVLLGALALLAVRRRFGARIAMWSDSRLRPGIDRLGAVWLGSDPRGLWRTCVLVFATAFAVRLVVWIVVTGDPARFVSGNLVMGVPFSDAQGWDSLGESIMRGDGQTGSWAARRPFYAWALGALYCWTGPSPFWAVQCNGVLGALTAALVCRIGQRIAAPSIGLCAGLAFAFDPVSIEYSRYVLSETLGTLLFVVSVQQMVAAVQQDRLRHGLQAGVCFALSNLTRTLTLLGLPLFALALLLLGRHKAGGWRRGVLLAAAFSIGAAVPIGGWIVRQQIEYGLTTISDNTASGLYAAASPAHRTWSSAVDREAELAGIPAEIKPRYDWFMQRFREQLAQDPWFFAGNAARSAFDALRGLARTPIAMRALLALLFLGMWLRQAPAAGARPRRPFAWFAVLLGGTAACAALPPWATLPAAALGALHALLYRGDRLMILPLLAVASTVAAMGLFALGQDHRLLLMTAWVLPYGLGHGSLWLTSALGRRVGCAAPVLAPRSAPVPAHEPTAQRFAARALLALLIATFAFLACRNLVRPLPPLPGMPAPTVDEIRAVARRVAAADASLAFTEEAADPATWYQQCDRSTDQPTNHGRLVPVHARLARHRYPIAGGVHVDHWSRMFADRAYDRTFTYATTLLPGGARGPVCVLFAAPPPRDDQRDLLLVGRADVDLDHVYEEVYLEVLAYAPLRADGSPELEQLVVTTSAGHAALLRSLRR